MNESDNVVYLQPSTCGKTALTLQHHSVLDKPHDVVIVTHDEQLGRILRERLYQSGCAGLTVSIMRDDHDLYTYQREALERLRKLYSQIEYHMRPIDIDMCEIDYDDYKLPDPKLPPKSNKWNPKPQAKRRW
jgi:hypothetical protein